MDRKVLAKKLIVLANELSNIAPAKPAAKRTAPAKPKTAKRRQQRKAAWGPDEIAKHLENMARAAKSGKMDMFNRMLKDLNSAKIGE